MSSFVSNRKRQMRYRDKHTEKDRQAAPSLLLGPSWLFLTGSWGGCECVCCEGLGVGIETVCRKRQFQAELRWQAIYTHFLCAVRQARAHTLACTLTCTGLQQGRVLAWWVVQENERAREGSMEGWREGGRREFSREQHFPTVWGFDTWLSHIPQPCGRPSISTQGKEGESESERERKVPPLALANNMELWKTGSVRVCSHVPVVCGFLLVRLMCRWVILSWPYMFLRVTSFVTFYIQFTYRFVLQGHKGCSDPKIHFAFNSLQPFLSSPSHCTDNLTKDTFHQYQ